MSVLIAGDLWDGFLDVELGIAAPLRCRVELPARRGMVLVDPDNGEREERDIPAEEWNARLLERLCFVPDLPLAYYVTYEAHRPWIQSVPTKFLRLDLAHREVMDHAAWSAGIRLGLHSENTAPEWHYDDCNRCWSLIEARGRRRLGVEAQIFDGHSYLRGPGNAIAHGPGVAGIGSELDAAVAMHMLLVSLAGRG